ncbi:hypothetical protein SEEACDC2_00100 [Salmonella enterica subsp. enterica serovar Agona str. SA-2]|nr:hypothetical protein SEEACDC2_00100 [Salmonella enterica subsp. enterica serovar Agona str. SA-2]
MAPLSVAARWFATNVDALGSGDVTDNATLELNTARRSTTPSAAAARW